MSVFGVKLTSLGEALGGTAGGVESPEEEMRQGRKKSVQKVAGNHIQYMYI